MKAVIFDMDGVLIDTERYLVKFWCQAGREYGYDFKKEHGLMLRSLAPKYAKPALKEIFGEEFPYEKVRQRRKQLMEEYLKEKPLEKKPGVDKLLDYLCQSGIKRAVATATDYERTEEYLKKVQIFDKFDQIICASMVKNGKPMPDIYLYACKAIGEEPGDCIAVEDSPNGVASASKAGCKTIMVPDLTEPDEACQALLYKKCSRADEIIRWLS